MLGLLFTASLLFTPLAFAYAYVHCTGFRMLNCGLGPALVLFSSLLSSGLALIMGALLLLLWQSAPMSRPLQRSCQILTGASTIYLLGCLVILTL